MKETPDVEPVTLLLEGDIYPYTRTTGRQKFVDLAYKMYQASQNAIRVQAMAQMSATNTRKLPPSTPLRLGIVLVTKSGLHKRDLSNQFKAIEDALQGVVFGNDAWVDVALAERFLGPENRCLVFIDPIPPGWHEGKWWHRRVMRDKWIGQVFAIAANRGVLPDGEG